MLCQNCGKNTASYHSVKNINGHVTETFLCNVCRRMFYETPGFGDIANDFDALGSMSDFADFFNSLANLDMPQKQVQTIACNACGTELHEFVNSLYVGCPNCYTAFSDHVFPILSSVQHGTTNIGKTPKGKEDISQYKKIESEIRKALLEERYEDVIVLREKLRELDRKKLQ